MTIAKELLELADKITFMESTSHLSRDECKLINYSMRFAAQSAPAIDAYISALTRPECGVEK